MINKNIKYVVIPDIHGRDFYLECVDYYLKNTNAQIVFLGDYIDPYPHEGITPDEALDKFKKIVEIKKNNNDRITLLIGNHDLHYIDGSRRGCRMDHYNKDEICSLFLKEPELFEYIKCVKIGNKNIIFSHAGVPFGWFYAYSEEFGIYGNQSVDEEESEKIAKENFNYQTIRKINWAELSKNREWLNRYGDVGSSRGGWSNHPSFLWADLSDHIFDKIRLSNCIQVFGHTMQNIGHYVHFDNCYCIDCQKVFLINENGTILTDEYKPLKNNGNETKEAYLAYYKKMSAFFL